MASRRAVAEVARFAVIIMCPSERAPPSTMRLFAASATKRPTKHNADYVSGHIIGKLALPALDDLKRLREDRDPQVRRTAAISLARMGQPDDPLIADLTLELTS